MHKLVAIALAAGLTVPITACRDSSPQAALLGVSPVKSGVVIRGLTLGGVPAPGQKTGHTCDFSREHVDQSGHMTDASVQCQPGGTYASTVPGLAGKSVV